jgi:hypothetical protein
MKNKNDYIYLLKMNTIFPFFFLKKLLYGFQSESKMITVLAVARLIPNPPAFVLRRKIYFLLSG